MKKSEFKKTEGRAMTLKEAVDTLDGVIPAPNNKMVDRDHLAIAIAWQCIKAALPPFQGDTEKRVLTYEDIRPEISRFCVENHGCWYRPKEELNCPYLDVCLYVGTNKAREELEAAMLARYKELKDGTKYGISVLPEDCLAYADGFRFGAYKAVPDGETTVVEFFKTEDEIREFVANHPQFRKKEES